MAGYLTTAEKELGQREKPGKPANPRIREYLETTNIGSPEDQSDETPWCSAFVNWVVEDFRAKVNRVSPKGTGRANARSWLNWGTASPVPLRGAIVILSRGAPPAGHVAFVVDAQENTLRIIGGNQSDAVTIAWVHKARVLGYRIPPAE